MKDVKGQMWEYDADWFGVTTNSTVINGKLIMGGGVAREAMMRFPQLPERWGRLIQDEQDPAVPDVMFDQETRTFAFPTKTDPSLPSPMWLVRRASMQLAFFARQFRDEIFVLPRPGAGLGGLNYDVDVRPVIENILPANVHVITW